MVKDLNIALESERALLRPLELDDEKSHQTAADDDSLWIFGIQDLSKPEELHQYIRNTVFYSILRSEWNAKKDSISQILKQYYEQALAKGNRN